MAQVDHDRIRTKVCATVSVPACHQKNWDGWETGGMDSRRREVEKS